MSAVVTAPRVFRWRTLVRWLPTFLGFPLGGLLAELVGPVDGLGPALAGGAVTGVVLGAVQSWGLAPNGPATRAWVAATGVGLAVGLAAGAATVDYSTGAGDLALQGAICGLAVGVAQAVTLRSRLGALAWAWAPWCCAVWALGWTITAAIGVDVERRYTVFGSSGAITVTVLSAILPLALAARADRGAR